MIMNDAGIRASNSAERKLSSAFQISTVKLSYLYKYNDLCSNF